MGTFYAGGAALKKMPWIKLATGMLRDEKIHFIIKKYGHDTMVVWTGLLTECNRGVLEMEEEIFAEVCIMDMQRFEEIKKIFIKFGLVTQSNGEKLKVTNWEKYQFSESYERVKAHREKSAKECNDHVTNTKQNVTVEVDTEVDKEKDVNKSPLPPSGEIPIKKNPVALKTYLDECHERKEKPVPETDPVFDYAASVRIPPEFLHLCWREFVDRHKDGGKRYRDWRKAFRNCVRGNWYRLWYADSGGGMALTTQGVLAKRKHTEAA